MPIPQLTETPRSNLILSALPASEIKKVYDSIELVRLEDGAILWDSDEKAEYLYFPTSSLISLLYENETGGSLSIATLGRSGVAGAGMIGGDVRTPDKAVVVHKGAAYRMSRRVAHNELSECGDFHSLMMTYTATLLTKISQNSICNRLHRIDQQLCRFLLDAQYDLQTESLAFTHEQIARILGVRRESVSLAAASLQRNKLIKTGRGKIRIIDAEQMAQSVCECYRVVKDCIEHALKQFISDHKS